jgi:hypothetical protein
MSGLNYWWTRFNNLRIKLKKYKDENGLKDVEDCIDHLLGRI